MSHKWRPPEQLAFGSRLCRAQGHTLEAEPRAKESHAQCLTRKCAHIFEAGPTTLIDVNAGVVRPYARESEDEASDSLGEGLVCKGTSLPSARCRCARPRVVPRRPASPPSRRPRRCSPGAPGSRASRPCPPSAAPRRASDWRDAVRLV